MTTRSVTIIGGSQAGLSISYYLQQLGVQHVVLERSSPGARWRDERWDSLRLLSPNWQVALPGYEPRPFDPDGFMSAREFGMELQKYARLIAAPMRLGVSVERVTRAPRPSEGFRLQTNEGELRSDSVVVATGQCAQPNIPAVSRKLSPWVRQLHSRDYRRADLLPPGGVLVVGASATGLQLAEELRRSGRRVVLSAGPHSRMLRRYRGRDIMTWLEKAGIFFDPPREATPLGRRTPSPSLQLLGSASRRDINLETLAEQGVEITGSLANLEGDRALFHDDLNEQLALSEKRLNKVLDRIDAYVATRRSFVPAAMRPRELVLPKARTELEFSTQGISTVLWATGYRADLSFLDVGGRNAEGELHHDGGVCSVPGLYLLGMNFMRQRNSSTISGTAHDARALATIIARQWEKETNHAA